MTPDDILTGLRDATRSLQTLTSLNPANLSARSLRVETDVIRLVGRWKSDAMMTYLRVAALAHN
jgi:hypothetical protein